jgi:hypothetical protein
MSRAAHAIRIASLGLVLGLGLAAPAVAAPASLTDQSTGTSCFTGTVATTFSYTTQHNCYTQTTTPDGRALVVFHAYLAAPSLEPTAIVTIAGFPCYTRQGPTTESSVVIDPDGIVRGQCLSQP